GDVVARYGGDEFALILPEATIANALILAERIRKVISSNDIKVNPKQSVKLTLSIGVAEFPIDGRHEEDLIAKADAMLYAAKRQGGNRVCSADTR
ncbi:MAG TPA: GGDEF domain-containing protein, partial [Nitrospirae bacterium]|nr:GGDEF domain-containing protein [Nitrospirota bacterium]